MSRGQAGILAFGPIPAIFTKRGRGRRTFLIIGACGLSSCSVRVGGVKEGGWLVGLHFQSLAEHDGNRTAHALSICSKAHPAAACGRNPICSLDPHAFGQGTVHPDGAVSDLPKSDLERAGGPRPILRSGAAVLRQHRRSSPGMLLIGSKGRDQKARPSRPG
jgi:hypothetical protein